MIASSAAIFAVLATLAAGQQFQVLPNASTRDQALAACANAGMKLAAISGANIEYVSGLLPANTFGWISSWEGNNYGGACLQLKAGTITVANSCQDLHLPVCEGSAQPCPPHPCPSSSSESCESSSSSSCESSSSSSCESSSSSSCVPEPSSCSSSSSESWSCESSSSSSCFDSSSSSCSDSFSSDICSSESSSEHCDPCCAGVRKLTYQAPFGAGIYLSKVTQRFSVFDAFGTNACTNVGTLALNLGVDHVLVGSDGLNACMTQITAAEATLVSDQTAANNAYTALTGLLGGTPSAAATGAIPDINTLTAAYQTVLTDLEALELLGGGPALQTAINTYITDVNAMLVSLSGLLTLANKPNEQYSGLTAYINSTPSIATSTSAIQTAITTPSTGDAAVLAAAVPVEGTIPYGTYYDVSRSWALNQPIYSLLSGVVSAANSIYNCYGEYVSIYLYKNLSDLTYITNNSGNVCFERCRGAPQSCSALCGGLKPPGWKLPFKMGRN